MKKPPKKVAYLWQLGVFFLYSHACPKQPRTSFPFYNIFIQPSLLESLSTLHSLQNDFAEFSFIFIRDTTENCVDLIALQFFVQVFSRQKERS